VNRLKNFMCLVVLLLAFGSQVAAEPFLKGSKAVELVELAHREGVILEERMMNTGAFVMQILVEGRYHFCLIQPTDQWCEDRTGYDDKYESK
jgi:hypothetical protein